MQMPVWLSLSSSLYNVSINILTMYTILLSLRVIAENFPCIPFFDCGSPIYDRVLKETPITFASHRLLCVLHLTLLSSICPRQALIGISPSISMTDGSGQLQLNVV